MKALLVPIDNRPVTYVFPQLVGRIAGIETLVPPRSLMGSLQANTNVDAVADWLSTALKSHKPDGLLACMDTLIYGGLIPSRRTEATTASLLEKTKVVPQWKETNPGLSLYAQSSIMRISDNYDNTEEKEYWSEFGREIFAWSEGMHRASGADRSKLRPGELSQLEARIPIGTRKDYLDTRLRNFQVNRKMLDYAQSGDIDFLVFSQDDSGEFGLNVMEKHRLISETEKRGLKNVTSYAGADEVLMTLLGRWLIAQKGKAPRVQVSYSPITGGNIASRYEGQTIGESVDAQLKAIGIESVSADPADTDLHVIIHTSGDRQGDHIWLPGHPDLRSLNTVAAVSRTMDLYQNSQVPCIVCDLAYSNGSDPSLVDALLSQPRIAEKLWGYAGWNTTGNTLGSALATGIARWFADGTGATSTEALKKALFIRFADDWAYQTQVRKQLGADLSVDNVKQLLSPHLKRLVEVLQFKPAIIEIGLPWLRSFEVEIEPRDALQMAQ